MAIALKCSCGRKLQVKDEFAGQEGQCPACGRTLQIPNVDKPVAASPTYQVVEEEIPAVLPAEEPSTPSSPAREEPMTNHGGGPLPRNADFFAAPPAEIGPITSVYTTLTGGQRPWSPGARLIAIGFSGLGGLVVGALIVVLCTLKDGFWQFLWPTVGSGLGALIAYGVTRFSHTCTYVGREGIAKFTCTGTRDNIASSETFRFRDATELRTSQTLRYVNGVYQNTTYTFTWSDVGGRARHVITGSHNSEKGEPPTGDLYHYARAAELAWTVYLLGQVQRQVDLAGSVAFNLKGGQWMRLGPQLLTYQLGGEPGEWRADEINGVQVDKGVVKIKRTDAKEGWFSSSGVLKFPFDSLANAQLFFHLVDRLLGVRVG